MTFKEWQAVIELTGGVLITGWLATDVLTNGGGDTVNAVAMKLLWAIGAAIVFNIVATIVISILVSIARREEFRDERADERDHQVAARSGNAGYAVGSIVAALALGALAFGSDPRLAAYALFAAPMAAGLASAAARLVHYRLG